MKGRWLSESVDSNPGSATFRLYHLSSLCSTFLIHDMMTVDGLLMDMRIIVAATHGFVSRINWMSLREALVLSNHKTKMIY